MTKFIKVTECNGNIVVLNTARIEHFALGTKGTDTYIKLLNNSSKPTETPGKENYFFVKESVEQLWEMLNTSYINPLL